MPPSTSSSVTRSAWRSPTWGRLAELLSILVTSTGRRGVAPVTGSPVNGHTAASCAPPWTGCDCGFLSSDVLPLDPPPQAASARLSTRATTRTAAARVDRRLDPRAGAEDMVVSMTKQA